MENKRAKVTMLPTEDKSNIVKLNSGNILYNYREPVKAWKPHYTNQHLYFTIDKKPKEGEWCINPKGLPDIFGFDYRAVYTREEILKCKKIISTTDTKLGVTDFRVSPVHNFIDLPQPSQAFIEKYCKVGGIWEVLVEYTHPSIISYKGENGVHKIASKPKVNSHNEITIHPIKDNWNKEELIGNGIDSLDNFLMNSVIYTQEQRELVMQVIYEWTEKNL